MKILHTVESYEPSKGGMQELVKQISEHLAKRGHHITVATSRHPERKTHSINGVSIRDFAVSGNSVRGINGESDTYQHFLQNSDFDIITNFAGQQWATDLMLPLLKDIKSKKVFAPTGFSALHFPEYSGYFEKMKTWMKEYDMNIFSSEVYQDIEFAKKNDIKKITMIPNGASELEFAKEAIIDIRKYLGIPAHQFLILQVGSHTGMKGHAEAIEIFRRSNLKNATFVMVGEVFSKYCYFSCKAKELLFMINPVNKLKNKTFSVRFLNRDQIVALYQSSDLFLFPSNIECSPIVLFECMASKTPFLTTDVGNAKEIIEWSHSGELLPTIRDKNGYSRADIGQSVKMLEGMFDNPEKRAAMQEAGFNIWQEQFSWEKIAKKYEDLYLKLLK